MEQKGRMQEWQVNVLALLRKKYAGGFWLHSPIEMTRLQGAYREQYGRELPAPEIVRAFFAHATVQQGDKVYLIDDETKERIFFCVQEYLESAHVIFYDLFFHFCFASSFANFAFTRCILGN